MHLRKRAHDAEGIDFSRLSSETESFSGAQLANLVNGAALVAGKDNRLTIRMDDFEQVVRQLCYLFMYLYHIFSPVFCS